LTRRGASAPATAPTPPARVAHAPREVRIIGGQWRRSKLPVADRPGLRPTPDRVRETLFNWLGQDLAGWRCADLFAGTGALGFEAASRGAAAVLMVEFDAGLVRQLQAVRERLGATGVDIRRGDGLAVLQALPPESQDLILLDPPFAAGLFDSLVDVVARALAPQGRLYLEAPEAWTDARLEPHGLQVLRHLKAGAVHAHLIGRAA
jgi:16S rRNA (guanine(966)-N(2))-methyltransferase RsmD